MQLWYLVIVVVAASATFVQAEVEFTYHSHEDLETFLHQTANSYPNITQLYSIGKSVKGKDLLVLALGEFPNDHVDLRPDVKIIGNIHGNEAVGREMLIHLIDYLTSNYEEDRINHLLRNTRIHLLVSLNPDGFQVAMDEPQEGKCGPYIINGRGNANGYDLNRNFPDFFVARSQPMQLEALAVIKWLRHYQFVLSASLHGGAMVVNYPYDNYKGVQSNARRKYSRSSDDDVFKHLSLIYSWHNPKMKEGACGDDFEFGITNGAAWYPVLGGMQDYNYIVSGCMEFTIEISCCKYPPRSELSQFWDDNRESLLKFIEKVHMGVKGMVWDTSGNPIHGADVYIEGRLHPVHTTTAGEYWRLLLPGEYTIKIFASGYLADIQSFEVRRHSVTVLHHTLKEINQAAHQKEVESPQISPTQESNSDVPGIGTRTEAVVVLLLWSCFVHLAWNTYLLNPI